MKDTTQTTQSHCLASYLCLALALLLMNQGAFAFAPLSTATRYSSRYQQHHSPLLPTSLTTISQKSPLLVVDDSSEAQVAGKRQRLWNKISRGPSQLQKGIQRRLIQPVQKKAQLIQNTYSQTISKILQALPQRSRNTLSVQLGASVMAMFFAAFLGRPGKALAMGGGMGGGAKAVEPMSQ